MKIAVATMDGVSVSQHFGQSKGFLVFDIEGAKVRSREFLTNNHTPHAQGLCNHSEGNHHGNHSHANILELLNGCDAVLCGGMGVGAQRALQQHGIKALLIAGPYSADEAVAAYMGGTLTSTEAVCNCRH